ncbi:MAG: SpoIIE family protein phosphatase [Bacteroidia bacterium]|nr:SpoIIE family protein phosphatase [Bacteroidia bacterium]
MIINPVPAQKLRINGTIMEYPKYKTAETAVINVRKGNICEKIRTVQGAFSIELKLNQKYKILPEKRGFITIPVTVNTKIPVHIDTTAKVWEYNCLIFVVKEKFAQAYLDELPDIPQKQSSIHKRKHFINKEFTDSLMVAITKNRDSIDEVTRSMVWEFRTKARKTKEPPRKAEIDSFIIIKIDSIIDGNNQVICNIQKSMDGIEKIQINSGDIKQKKDDLLVARELLEINKKNARTKHDSLLVQVKEMELNETENQMLLAEKQLENARKTIELQKYKIYIQKILIGASLAGLIILIASLIFVFRLYRLKKHAYKLLEDQNSKIIIQKSEIETQRDEIEAQRDEITTQRDVVIRQKQEIELIHKELKDSINYAERIQNAILPTLDYLRQNVKEHFIIFKPRDIVSGDFYFIQKIDNWLLFAVADCTGHGVPGAFMSMMGVAFLSEIVAKKHITTANQVLDELRDKIIKTLHQVGFEYFIENKSSDRKNSEGSDVRDGMDIAFCALNLENKQLQYAGANCPLYLIQTAVKQPFELEEIKADKMPIGIHFKIEPFKNRHLQLKSGDTLYLCSDGYADQIGGAKAKKIMSRPFMQILVEASSKTLPEQKQIIEYWLSEWMSHINPKTGKMYEQIDDITVMGIRI